MGSSKGRLHCQGQGSHWERMGPWLPGWRQWSCQPPKSWIFMDAVIVISVNDKGKVDRQGNRDLQRTKRWLLEGDGCVATRRSTGWLWVLLSHFNGEWTRMAAQICQARGSWSHYLLLRWTTEISGDTGWGWVGSTIVRRGGWRWASSVGLRLATALEAMVSCRKVVQRSSFQDVHAIVDPKSTKNGWGGFRDVLCRSPRCRTCKLGRQPFLETGN